MTDPFTLFLPSGGFVSISMAGFQVPFSVPSPRHGRSMDANHLITLTVQKGQTDSPLLTASHFTTRVVPNASLLPATASSLRYLWQYNYDFEEYTYTDFLSECQKWEDKLSSKSRKTGRFWRLCRLPVNLTMTTGLQEVPAKIPMKNPPCQFHHFSFVKIKHTRYGVFMEELWSYCQADFVFFGRSQENCLSLFPAKPTICWQEPFAMYLWIWIERMVVREVCRVLYKNNNFLIEMNKEVRQIERYTEKPPTNALPLFLFCPRTLCYCDVHSSFSLLRSAAEAFSFCSPLIHTLPCYFHISEWTSCS